jgi:hypothetical protein
MSADGTDFELAKKMLDLQKRNPDLYGKLGLWMASAATLESKDPEAAAGALFRNRDYRSR